MLVLGFADYREQAQRLAQALAYDYAEVEIHHFPDGESRVTLPPQMPTKVVVCRSLDHPNNKLIELMLTAEVARQQGVTNLALVAPYLCYMRQDIAFHPGEAVSQKIIGRWLSDLFDTVVTVDPHLHRISNLSEAIPNAHAICLTATTSLAEFLKQHPSTALLLGPDAESRQWVKQIGEATGLEWAVATKQRYGDHDVEIALPEEAEFKQRTVVIVDDVASTGHTLAMTAQALVEAGAARIECLVTHALLRREAERELYNAGIEHIISTDSVSHPSNRISLAPLLAKALS